MPPKPPPPGIEVPVIPAPLPAGTPRIDRTSQDPRTLPDYARPWAEQNAAKVVVSPATRPTQPPPARTPAELIVQTYQGVEALQVLIEPPEAPTKTDTILELLEGIDNRTFRMEERQKVIETTLIAILKHLRQRG